MRRYREFNAKFYRGPDSVTGEDVYDYSKMVIDLNSIVALNPNPEPGYTTVTMVNGVCYAVHEDYESLKRLVMQTSGVTHFSAQ